MTKQYMTLVPNPKSVDELMSRAYNLAGKKVKDIASTYNLKIPTDTLHSKGWLGVFLEAVLGADGSNNPIQDFTDLKIELKSIPISNDLVPYESTYICVVPLLGNSNVSFYESNFFNKIKKILWFPFDGNKNLAIAEKNFFTPFLWSPNQEELQILKQDWEEHMEKISTGQIENITAKDGTALQIRPKAANGRILTDAIGRNGQLIQTRPRGFYLRPSFTQKILKNKFL